MSRLVLSAAIALLCFLETGAVAHAEPNGDPGLSTVSIGPMASGGVVSEGSAGYDTSGTQATAGSRNDHSSSPPADGGGGDYTYRALPNNQVPIPQPVVVNNAGVINVPQTAMQNACPPGQTGYLVYGPGGNGSFGVICVAQGQTANTPELQLAQDASSKQPWPNLVLGVNPGAGLTGLASWFWLGGGSPAMPDATASIGPLSVTVHAALVGATWDFGDGSRYDSRDLGQAYPAPSDVQHVYQTDTYGLPGGYTVSGILRFLVTYSVNGGPWQQLGVKTKAFSRSYAVFQLQPEAVSGQ